jgi:hypothetical protein
MGMRAQTQRVHAREKATKSDKTSRTTSIAADDARCDFSMNAEYSGCEC